MRFTLPFLKKKIEKPYYFCLYITDRSLAGFVLEVNAHEYKVRAEKKLVLTSGFDKILEDTDNLISELEMKVASDLDKTIFFLPSQMIDAVTHEIKDPYKTTIKNISRELELEPMGYIDVAEAVQGYINKKLIVNCIVTSLSETEIGVSIYKGGVIAHTQYSPRTDDVAADLEEVLNSVPDKRILPTKIIIYGDNNNDEISSTISSHNWDEKIFAEHPTIIALNDSDLYIIFADTFVKELSQGNVETTSESETQDTLEEDATSFGFVFGGDIRDTDAKEPEPQHHATRPSSNRASTKFFKDIKHKAVSFFSKLTRVNKKSSGRNYIVIAAVSLASLAVVFISYEYFLHKATVTIYLQSKNESDSEKLELPVTQNPSSKELTVISHTKVIEFTDKKNTTGSRDIGEKAKGDITVHNFDNSERSIERGTELAKGDLKFVLDSDVKVASASGVTSDGTKQSGKAKTTVTASEIGTAHNIAKATQLAIGSLPESLYVAIADSDFTGGTQKKIKTVSADDMESLEANAKKEATDNASKKLNIKVGTDELLISELTKATVATSKFSKEIGEEADTVSIQANTEIDYYTVSKSLLQKKIKEFLLKNNKEYSLSESTLTIKFENAEIADDEVTLAVQFNANIYKDIDVKKVQDELTLSSSRSITSKLQEKYNVEDVKITNSASSIGFLTSWTPLFQKNITVLTTAK